MSPKLSRRGFAGILAGSALALTVALAPAVQAADFSGKRLRIVVPFNEGGGTDSLTRALQPFMEKHLPGNPKILVVNKPGAGGIVGGNYFESNAKKDGTWVMALSTSTILNYILADPRVKFDIKGWEPIVLLPRSSMQYARAELGLGGLGPKDMVAKLRTIPKEKLVFGGKTPTSAALSRRLALSLLGVEVKDVWGMKGNGPMAQAFERGEFTLMFDNSLSYLNNRKGFRDAGIVTHLFTWGAPDANGKWKDANGKYFRDPTWPNVPSYYEFYEEATGKKFEGPAAKATLAIIRVGTLANKSFHLPKGADKDALEAWRNALRKTMEDPEFNKRRPKILGKFLATIGPEAKTALHEAMILSDVEKEFVKDYVKVRYNLTLNM
ncbi:MAG: tripartite tricarboxylate transporter substrate-binding protein [Rhodospirillaceae bacterium]|nr:tripartite tricarboxylate transporter substrate-binding protein [Rhodospirillaceae bacterium]